MKRTAALILLLTMALALAGCGTSASSPAPATAAPATAAPATAEPASAAPAIVTAAKEEGTVDLAALVEKLNAEQDANQKPGDAILRHYELGEGNTILYKVTIEAIEVFTVMAESGEQGALDAYNNTIMAKLPAVQREAQEKIEKEAPGVNVVLRLCTNSQFNRTIAAIENGQVVYDRVNKIGTAPADDAPQIKLEDLPPELLEKMKEAMQNSVNNASQGQ